MSAINMYANLTEGDLRSGNGRMLLTPMQKAKAIGYCALHQISAHALPANAEEMIAFIIFMGWETAVQDTDLLEPLATKLLAFVRNNVNTDKLRPGMVEVQDSNTKVWTATWKAFTVQWALPGGFIYGKTPLENQASFESMEASMKVDRPAIDRPFIGPAALVRQTVAFVEDSAFEEEGSAFEEEGSALQQAGSAVEEDAISEAAITEITMTEATNDPNDFQSQAQAQANAEAQQAQAQQTQAQQDQAQAQAMVEARALLSREQKQLARLQQKREDQIRLEKERQDQIRLENKRQDQIRLEKERQDLIRLENKRQDQIRLEKERQDLIRLEKERQDLIRLENERLENERLEKERLVERRAAKAQRIAVKQAQACRTQEYLQCLRDRAEKQKALTTADIAPPTSPKTTNMQQKPSAKEAITPKDCTVQAMNACSVKDILARTEARAAQAVKGQTATSSSPALGNIPLTASFQSVVDKYLLGPPAAPKVTIGNKVKKSPIAATTGGPNVLPASVPSRTDYQAILDKYAGRTSTTGGTKASPALVPSRTGYQAILDQYAPRTSTNNASKTFRQNVNNAAATDKIPATATTTKDGNGLRRSTRIKTMIGSKGERLTYAEV
ncbi:Reticulocyte-binding protein 2 a [Fulvia fulva]|uniref:Reticulocyte-binding protein 2 a n=1 Tax=Passalora fulva TaxID=5499 RepID=A0A9Q8PMZ3_PASFU|nr:Reticulocyte-binding protein 2 a [Fulvia fulva]KAK4608880.1 hypothetical protein CLAFUR0_14851 [Fulvia fulva]UJO25427.1 Reticulocyte-binding protein 2 a [Fulvia fulva]